MLILAPLGAGAETAPGLDLAHLAQLLLWTLIPEVALLFMSPGSKNLHVLLCIG